jgi:hypothetical protein
LIAGFLTAGVCAILWAIITKATSYQIGWMAIGVGFLVGIAVRLAGKGRNPVFGIVGALMALLGCLAGNFLSVLIFGAEELQGSITFLELLQFFIANPAEIVSLMKETFQSMDLFFYAIAMYEGYRFSIVSEPKQIAQPPPPLPTNP